MTVWRRIRNVIVWSAFTLALGLSMGVCLIVAAALVILFGMMVPGASR